MKIREHKVSEETHKPVTVHGNIFSFGHPPRSMADGSRVMFCSTYLNAEQVRNICDEMQQCSREFYYIGQVDDRFRGHCDGPLAYQFDFHGKDWMPKIPEILIPEYEECKLWEKKQKLDRARKDYEEAVKGAKR